MILDSSAVVAVVIHEPHAERIVDRLLEADSVGIGAPTLAETSLVLAGRLGEVVHRHLTRLLTELNVHCIPFGEDHWPIALDAFLRFGKGRHPARLNFGDCLTYAIARRAQQSLLCLGDDFARTDLEVALVDR